MKLSVRRLEWNRRWLCFRRRIHADVGSVASAGAVLLGFESFGEVDSVGLVNY